MQWQELRSHLRHLSDSDLKMVQAAFVLGQNAHAGQLRKSGEPYFTHPVAIAHLLADMGGDADTIIAALLHDTIEDTHVTLSQIRMEFGDIVANLIDGLTKLERSDLGGSPSLDEQIETLRKMFTLMQQDVRIMVIKLIDRLHNMQTIAFLSPEKQRAMAQETLDVYVKIADRLSMQDLRDELESLAIAVITPEEHVQLENVRVKNEREGGKTIAAMTKALAVNHASLLKKVTTLHEHKTWKELGKQVKTGDAEITGQPDLIIVFLCQTIDDCYAILGVLHQEWQRETLSFQDYINSPLLNGYQGLHTTVILQNGIRVRCKIRTNDMHVFARKGIASRCFDRQEKGVLEYFPWTQRISTVSQDTTKRSEEFWENLQSDILGESMVIHGPHGEAMQIPSESTALDAAFYFFGEKALRAQDIRVNGLSVNFSLPLENAASVEVFLAKKHTVQRTWLGWVRTGLATAFIRSALGGQSLQTLARTGKEVLQSYFTAGNKGFIDEFDHASLLGALHTLGYLSLETAYSDIAQGHLDPSEVYALLFERRRTGGEETVTYVRFRYHAATKELLRLQSMLSERCISLRVRLTSSGTTQVTAACKLNTQEQRSLREELNTAGAHDIELRRGAFRIPLSVGFLLMLILWGLDPVFAHMFLASGTAPVNLTLIRFVSFFFMTGILFLTHNLLSVQKFKTPSLRDPSLLLAGVTMFLTACSTYFALLHISPSQYIIIILLGSILPTEISSVLRGRSWKQPVLRVSALTLLLATLLWSNPTDTQGLSLAVASGIGFALYTVLSERYKESTHIRARYASFLFLLSIAALPYTILLFPFSTLSALSTGQLLLIVGFVGICNILPYGLYYALANRRDMPPFALLATAVPTLLAEAWTTKEGWLLVLAMGFLGFTLHQLLGPQREKAY